MPISAQMPSDLNRATRVSYIANALDLKPEYYGLFAEILMHWRNRIIHASNTCLTENKNKKLKENSKDVWRNFKHLEIDRMLKEFNSNTPTLKEVSTIIAITIRFVRCVDEKILTPQSKAHLDQWLLSLKLDSEIDEITKRYTSTKAENEIKNLLRTKSPELIGLYSKYYLN